MGSHTSRREMVDPGRTLIAEVTSSGALMYAPRTLQLLVGADAICVRSLDGRLMWLETDYSSALTAADGRVREDAHSGEEVVMVPPDTAAEAKALVSLSAALAWSAATLQPGSQQADPEQFEQRTADIRTAITDDGRPLQIVLDRDTGVVLAIAGESLRGPFELKLRRVHVVDSTADHFAARHL